MPALLEAPTSHDLFIAQDWNAYTPENHLAWQRLYGRMRPEWKHFANERFLEGVDNLCFPADRIPRLDDVNRFLCPLTGFRARAVAGYIPAFHFFDCLRRREFPTTVTIRPPDQLDYLPEPDIFHDIAGHVPMHTDTAFANTLVRFGECAATAARIAAADPSHDRRMRRLQSNIRAMARFFWFTVEFGLMHSPQGTKAYGSGLLSSFGELRHAIESSEVQRYDLRLEWVVNQAFEIDHYQPLLFVVDSFNHLFHLVGELEQWLLEGRLDNVAPGEPTVAEADLESFVSGS